MHTSHRNRIYTVDAGFFLTAVSPAILVSFAVTSDMVVCLYDSVKKIGSMARVSKKMKGGNNVIERMIDELRTRSVVMQRLLAKISGDNKAVKVIQKTLEDCDIKVIQEDIGGTQERTVTFFIDTGKVRVERPNREAIIA